VRITKADFKQKSPERGRSSRNSIRIGFSPIRIDATQLEVGLGACPRADSRDS